MGKQLNFVLVLHCTASLKSSFFPQAVRLLNYPQHSTIKSISFYDLSDMDKSDSNLVIGIQNNFDNYTEIESQSHTPAAQPTCELYLEEICFEMNEERQIIFGSHLNCALNYTYNMYYKKVVVCHNT